MDPNVSVLLDEQSNFYKTLLFFLDKIYWCLYFVKNLFFVFTHCTPFLHNCTAVLLLVNTWYLLPSFLPAKYLIKKKETHQRFNKIILSRTLQQFLNKYEWNILFFYLIGFVLNIGSDFFMVFGKDFSISICCPCNSVMPRYSY